ncbi:MAG: hypothetical protein MJ252_09765 [archaeon]|nr:hypothetical protein [archaeon]
MSVYSAKLAWIKDDIINSYYNSLNEKEKNKYIELKSAIVIQKNVRALLCRKRFLLLKKEALEVQKAFRGYLARATHEKDVAEQNDNLMKQFFEYHATIIIKHWKGYKFRKYVMDYHANKKWLEKTKKLNEETFVLMKEQADKRQYELDRENEERQRKKFIDIAKNLHHLVSTKHIPGVYNVPYLPAELKPQVYNADIEEHLKSIFKSSLRKKGRMAIDRDNAKVPDNA